MIETYILCILFAIFYMKYPIKPILKYWGTYLFIAVEILYVYLQYTIFAGNYFIIQYEAMVKPVFTLIMYVFIFKYRLYIQTLIASGLMLFGQMLNHIVITANNNKMPVFPSLTYLTGYAKPNIFTISTQLGSNKILGDVHTKLKILSDWIDIGYCVMSIGDLFIRAGVFILLLYAIKKSKDYPCKYDIGKIFYNIISLKFIRIWSYKLSKGIHNYLKSNGDKYENKYFYNYFFNFIFSTLYGLFAISVIGYSLGLFWETMIVTIVASSLRMNTGGIHMDKMWKCFYIWLSMYTLGTFVTKRLAIINTNWNLIALFVISVSIVVFLITLKFKNNKSKIIVLLLIALILNFIIGSNIVTIASCIGVLIQLFTILPLGRKIINLIGNYIELFINKIKLIR